MNIFRTLHHVCIVVRDLEQAVAYYQSMGIGPWTDFPSLAGFETTGYEREGLLNLRYRFAELDNVQIQLCQPGEGVTPQRTFLETRGEGVFHLGFSVADCDTAQAAAEEAGLPVLGSGRMPNGSGFTYFDTAREGAGVNLMVRARR
nr:VOC family protein [Pseudomonas sp. R5(2019)]